MRDLTGLFFLFLTLLICTPMTAYSECALLRSHYGVGVIIDNIIYGDGLGREAAFVGDINGDGFEDYALKRDRDFARGDVQKGVSFYSGKTGEHLFKINAPSSLTLHATSVGSLGDLSGSGKGYFYISHDGDLSSGSPLIGTVEVYRFLGGVPELVYTLSSGVAQTEHFGRSVAVISDLTGDGISEIIVGAPNQAKLYLFSGADGSLIGGFDPGVPGYESSLGESIVSLGDLTGDGYDEIAVADLEYSEQAGAVAIMSTRLIYQQAYPILDYVYGGSPWISVGRTLSVLGDLTGDGRPELAIALGSSLSDYPLGEAVVFSVNTNGEMSQLYSVTGPIEENFAQAIAPFGDIDGDGVVDFAVGSPQATPGRVSFYSGASSLLIGTIEGELSSDYFGGNISTPVAARTPVVSFGLISASLSNLGNDLTGYEPLVTQPDPHLSSQAGAGYLVAPVATGTAVEQWELCTDPPPGGGSGGGSGEGGDSGGSDSPDNPDPQVLSEEIFQGQLTSARQLIRKASRAKRPKAMRKARRELRGNLREIRMSILGAQVSGGPFRHQRMVRKMMRGFRQGKNKRLSTAKQQRGWRILKRSLNRLMQVN